MWNWPETFVVDDGWQDFRSETFLVDTIKVLEEEIHSVMSEQFIVQTEENLNYTMTEITNEFSSITIALGEQTSEESSVQFELLQERVKVVARLQNVQAILFKVRMFYAGTLLEVNKCFEVDKSYGFVHEQQFELQWYWSEEAMCQKLCHVARKLGKAVKGNAKSGTQVMNSPFGKKSDFEFNVSLAEEIIPSDSNVWNHWSGYGNSGMDAVAQGNGIDKTQLSNSHRKQPKKKNLEE